MFLELEGPKKFILRPRPDIKTEIFFLRFSIPSTSQKWFSATKNADFWKWILVELGFFSKCPLTVCVWADKNGGYDDDIHHTPRALKGLMYFARLSVVVRTGENDWYTIRVEEKRRKRLCFQKYSDTWGRGLKRFYLVVVPHIFPFILQSSNFLLSVKHSSKIFQI